MKKTNYAKTKIVATIGPASDSEEKLTEMILAGVDVCRFNMKHGEVSWLDEKMSLIRKICKKLDTSVAILVDLQGQDLRSGKLRGGRLELKKGEKVWLVANQDLVYKTDKKLIVIEVDKVIKVLKKGHIVLLDDGALVLEVVGRKTIKGELHVQSKVIEGGVLTDRKGVNLPGICPDIPVLVKKDFDCLSLTNKKDIDYVGQSFVANKDHIIELKKELKKRGIEAGIVAKIERQEAIENFEEILDESEGIMVARGDLGVEIPLHEVPFWQKHMIKRCREVAKPVITATQMLQSMVENPIPTRAEISDVANAVYDGTDAVMLSAETSMGKYPVKSVQVMNREARFIESKTGYRDIDIALPEEDGQTLAMVEAAHTLACNGTKKVLDLAAMVVLTETGKTARYLSRLKPCLPVLVVSNNPKTRDQLEMSWGTKPYHFSLGKKSELSIQKVLKFLKAQKELKKGDKVVMVYGDSWGEPGLTSVARIQTVV